MRSKVFNLALVISGFVLGAACNSAGPAQGRTSTSDLSAQGHPASPPAAGGAPMPAARRIPAHFTEPPDAKSLAPTLPPDQFTGRIREAYQAARKIPRTLAQLPCFCYCDASVGHESLHSCYESGHSAHCSTCQDEAILAAQLKKEGLADAQIRERIIARYMSR